MMASGVATSVRCSCIRDSERLLGCDIWSIKSGVGVMTKEKKPHRCTRYVMHMQLKNVRETVEEKKERKELRADYDAIWASGVVTYATLNPFFFVLVQGGGRMTSKSGVMGAWMRSAKRTFFGLLGLRFALFLYGEDFGTALFIIMSQKLSVLR